MMRTVMTAAAVLVLVSFTGGLQGAEVTTSLDLVSAYVFRGATFNDGFVLQPGMEVSGLPVSIGVWANMDIDDYDDTLEDGQISEIDLYASYDFPLDHEKFSLSAGYTEYTYPSGGGDADREISLSAGYDHILSPSLAVYYGLDGGIDNSTYIELGGGYEHQINEDLTGSAGLAFGYMAPDEGDSGLSHADISASISYRFVTLTLKYVAQLDDDVLPDTDDGGPYDVEFLGSLGVSYDF